MHWGQENTSHGVIVKSSNGLLYIFKKIFWLAKLMGYSSLTRDQILAPWHWQRGVLTTGCPGKSLGYCVSDLTFPFAYIPVTLPILLCALGGWPLRGTLPVPAAGHLELPTGGPCRRPERGREALVFLPCLLPGPLCPMTLTPLWSPLSKAPALTGVRSTSFSSCLYFDS